MERATISGSVLEPGAVVGELLADRLVVRLGLALGRVELDQVDEQAAALDVGEELVAEPGALRRSLDQTGDVGEHDLAVVEVERAEHRLDRGEGIVGDLRRGPGQPANSEDLPAFGSPTSPTSASSFSRSSISPDSPSSPRSAKRGACRVEVAKRLLPWPPAPPRATTIRWPVGEQLGGRAVDPGDDGPRRHGDHLVLTPSPVLVLARAVATASGPEVAAAPERRQVATRRVADQDDVAPAAAVAAVGPAAGHVRLAAERDDAVAAATTLDVDLRPVEQHRGDVSRSGWRVLRIPKELAEA